MKFDPKKHIDAYLDGELSTSEKERFELALQRDQSLAEEVYALSAIKQRIQNHYRQISVPKMSVKTAKSSRQSIRPIAYAASVAFALMVGFFVGQQPKLSFNSVFNLESSTPLNRQHVILHLDSNHQQRAEKLLKETLNN